MEQYNKFYIACTTYLPVEACELHHRYLRATLSAEKCQQTVSKIVKNRKIVKKAWNENTFWQKSMKNHTLVLTSKNEMK